MVRKKICIVTGSRAEYGLLYWVIREVNEAPSALLQLVVCGTHLCLKHGMTVREIQKDGFKLSGKVRMPMSLDTELGIAKSISVGIKDFASIYKKLKPDIIVVLGDRFEILAAVVAALSFRIPIAHIHGGESTQGLIDEAIRNAITKMSHIHFTSTAQHRARVIQMGETPERVFCFGAPGIDNIYKRPLLSKKEIFDDLDLSLDDNIGIITYHPVTLEKGKARQQISEVLKSIDRVKGVYWVFTTANADAENSIINRAIKYFVNRHKTSSKLFISLGSLKYLSLLKSASLMVGNSSSGLIEAASFKLPVVNIGDRQGGRTRGRNVIDVPACRAPDIEKAIKKALSTRFKRTLKGMKNPYGREGASAKIACQLIRMDLKGEIIKKKFYQIKNLKTIWN